MWQKFFICSTQKGRIFDADVFKAFEESVQSTNPNEYMLNFIANGAAKEIYYPKKPYYLTLFKDKIQDQSNILSVGQIQSSKLFLKLYLVLFVPN